MGAADADIAKLGIQVDSSQFKSAQQDMSRFVDAGKRVESATAAMQQTVKQLQQTLEAVGLPRHTAALEEHAKAHEKAAAASEKLHAGLESVQRALEGLGVGLTLREFVELADEMATMEARLRLVTTGTANLARVQQELFDTAQSTRSSLADTEELYLHLAETTGNLGLSQRDLLTLTRTLTESFVLNGRSAKDASAAARQLGIAFATNSADWRQMRKILQEAPELASTIAEGMGVTVAKLKELTNQGKLSGEQIVQGILKASQEVDKSFSTLPKTVGQALTQLQNAFAEFVHQQDESSGATATMVKGIDLLREHLDSVVKLLSVAAFATFPGVLLNIAKGFSVLAALGNPFAAIAAAVSVATGALYVYRDAVVSIGGITGTIGDIVKATWQEIAEVGARRFGELQDAVAPVVAFFNDRFGELSEFFARVLTTMVDDAETAVRAIIGFFVGMADAQQAAGQAIVDNFRAEFTNIANLAAAIGEVIKNAFTHIWEPVDFTPIKKALQNQVQGAAQGAGTAWVEGFKKGYGSVQQKSLTDSLVLPFEKARDNIGKVSADIQAKILQMQREADDVQKQTVGDLNGPGSKTSDNLAKQIDEYDRLVRSIKAKNAEAEEELRVGHELTDAEKMRFDFLFKIESGELQVSKAQKQRVLVMLDLLQANQEQVKWERELNQLAEQARSEEEQKVKAAKDELASISKATVALQDQTEEIGKNAQQVAELRASRLEVAAATDEATAADLRWKAQFDDNGDLMRQQAEQLDMVASALRNEARAVRENGDAQFADQLKKDMQKAAEDAQRQWKQTADKIENWLSDAFLRSMQSGESFFKSLVDALKTMFARLILQPIFAPISGALASAFGGSSAFGGIGGGTNYVMAGQQLWQGFNTGFTTFGKSLGTLVSQLGTLIGSPTLQGFGLGMGLPAGSALPGLSSSGAVYGGAQAGMAAAPYLNGGLALIGGVGLGNALSGGLAIIGNNPSTTTAIGSAIGLAAAGPIGAVIGGALGGLANRLFGSGPEHLTGLGISGSYANGQVSAQNYATYHSSGGLFGGGGDRTQTSPLDPATVATIQNAFATITESINGLAKTVGDGAFTLSNISEDFKVGFQNTGNAEADAKANLEQLQKLFASFSNDLANQALPGLSQLARAGETATETLTRIATEIGATDQVLAMMGKTSQQAFGAVGIASLAARERLIAFAGGIDKLTQGVSYFNDHFLSDSEKVRLATTNVATELAKLGVGSITTKDQFKQLVQSQDLSTEAGARLYAQLLNLAPAFDQAETMVQQMEDAAQQAVQQAYQQVQATEQALNQARQSYQQTLGQIDEAYNAIAEKREELHQQRLEEERKAAQDRELKELQAHTQQMQQVQQQAEQARQQADQKVAQAQQTLAQAYQREAQEVQQRLTDAHNALIAAYQREEQEVQNNLAAARQDLVNAYNKEAQGLQQTIDRFREFAKAMAEFRQSLLTGDLSPLTPIQQYQQDKQRFNDLVQRAKAGDPEAQSQVQGAATDFLNASKTAFASGSQYQSDFATVQDALKQLGDSATQQANDAQAQLDALHDQVSQLVDLGDKTLSVKDAIAKLTDAQKQVEMLQDMRDQVELLVDLGDKTLSVKDAIDQLKDAQHAEDQLQALHDQVSQLVDLNDQVLTVDQAIDNLNAAQAASAEAQRQLDIANLNVQLSQQAEQAFQDRVAQEELVREHMQQDQELAAYEAQQYQRIQELQVQAQQQEGAIYQAEWAHDEALAALQRAQEQYWAIQQNNLLGQIVQQLAVNNQLTQQQTAATQQAAASPGGAPAAAPAAAPQTYIGSNGFEETAGIPEHALGLDYVPYDGYLTYLHKGERVLTDVQARFQDRAKRDASTRTGIDTQALRAELTALRETLEDLIRQQAQATEAQVRAAYDAAKRSADTIVAGQVDAADRAAYRERARAAYE
jgi:tape measure domain-containing protein